LRMRRITVDSAQLQTPQLNLNLQQVPGLLRPIQLPSQQYAQRHKLPHQNQQINA